MIRSVRMAPDGPDHLGVPMACSIGSRILIFPENNNDDGTMTKAFILEMEISVPGFPCHRANSAKKCHAKLISIDPWS